tara:strand:- start:9 stop:158 length:150 start_codon:yes stop_codon:yes gene_type:complete
MKKITNKETTVRKYSKRKNIIGNFRGSEDIFWKKVRDGMKKFLEPAFKG